MQSCVSDTSLCYLSQNVPVNVLASYARFLLETGIGRLEMPLPVWQRLRPDIAPEKVTVVIQNPLEREQGLQTGIVSFVTNVPVFIDRFTDAYPDVWVVVPVDDGGNLCADVSWSDRCGGLRAAGFTNGMTGDYAAAFQKLRRTAQSLDVGDMHHLATAASVEWLLAGGTNVAAAFGGAGGRTSLEQLLAALHVVCGADYDLRQMPRLRTLFSQLTGWKCSPYAPVMGEEIFTYESGIHADGIQKNPKTYEPFPPEDVGAERRLSIGKHSGKAALRIKLIELGMHLNEAELDWMNMRIREESTRLRRGFTDAELLALVHSRYGRR